MFPQNNEQNHRVFQRAFITIALGGDCPITNNYTSDTLTNILLVKEMVLLEHFIGCTWYTFSWSQQWKKVIRPWFPVFSFYNVYSHFARHFLIYPHFVQKVKSLITVTWLQKIINLLQIPCLLQCSNLLLLNNVVKCGSCINFQTIWIKYWSWLRERWRDPSQHPAENYLVISARKHGSSISELWTKTSFIIKQFLLEYGMDAENINFKGNLCILISKIFLPHLFVSKLINPRNFEISA